MPDALRTAEPGGKWESFRFTAESGGNNGIKDAIKAGVSYLYLIGDTVGAVLETVAAGEIGVLIYAAEKIMLPKKVGSGEAFNVGERIYWDPADRLCTPNYNSGYYWIGIATEPAVATDERVEARLEGHQAEVEPAL